jgi:hypothetical protein
MKLYAIACIHRNPLGNLASTGNFDDAGNPILSAIVEEVAPGTVFDAADDEARDLIKIGAAMPVEDWNASRETAHEGGWRDSPMPVGVPVESIGR